MGGYHQTYRIQDSAIINTLMVSGKEEAVTVAVILLIIGTFVVS